MLRISGAKPTPQNQDDSEVRYRDHLAKEWIRWHAPCRWQGNVKLKFLRIPYAKLEPAGSRVRPGIVERWLLKLRRCRPIPPLIVCPTERGTYYVREGNHRYRALRLFLGANAERSRIRVAFVRPKAGFGFRYRWFGTYGTYQLEPCRFASALAWREPWRGRESEDRVGQWTTGSSSLAPLLGRTLVIAAHPDDETACAVLLQRMRQPALVFVTEGAPAVEFFWRGFGSQENYAAVRRAEARRAVAAIGISHPCFLSERCRSLRDQELYLHLEECAAILLRLTEKIAPAAVLVPAYEGGHPDHDVCSFLGHAVGATVQLPVWEMPLYHRSSSGSLVHQQFFNCNGREVMLQPTAAELRQRQKMVAAYASQHDLNEYLAARVEVYRPQLSYDYSRPPHPWQLNYEAWQWPMTGSDVCRALLSYLRASHLSPGMVAGRPPAAQNGLRTVV